MIQSKISQLLLRKTKKQKTVFMRFSVFHGLKKK